MQGDIFLSSFKLIFENISSAFFLGISLTQGPLEE